MIRPLYPTDLLSLPFFSRRALANEAITRDRLRRASLLSAEALLEHWLPLKGRRHTWVSLDRGRILGVVSTKSCSRPTAWQIDYLQVDDEERCLALLDKASAAAGEKGVRKIFLRLPATSPLFDGVRRAGFSCYIKDYLFRYGGEGGRGPAEAPRHYLLRPRSRADEYSLFGLYGVAVPLAVRTAEGMTLEEWQESRDRWSWLERHREFVLEKQGSLVAWLRISVAGGMGCFEILFHPCAQDELEWLVSYGLTYLDGKSSILCIVSAFQGQLRVLLERLEFEEVAEYSTLVREIALRVREPSFMPMRA
ncbi:MAG: hypothetical protein ACE5IE_00235 [Dehalococcoidia bacterium]